MTRGERIRYLRENRIPRKWSQEELGKKQAVSLSI